MNHYLVQFEEKGRKPTTFVTIYSNVVQPARVTKAIDLSQRQVLEPIDRLQFFTSSSCGGDIHQAHTPTRTLAPLTSASMTRTPVKTCGSRPVTYRFFNFSATHREEQREAKKKMGGRSADDLNRRSF